MLLLGFWKNGQRDGHGIQTWPDSSRYEGDWVEDKVKYKLLFNLYNIG